ncbi:MAG: hypothetical protein A3A51_01340 [Candidatus Levybacteria bacterium RIFCSPLOWO2_01_FULL_39_10]|nr:MAG: hypothetical protein A3A51_01340 [Candidatus Levybacteria bacterium RIFCSPLOWO2_01_FULL_39_10]
MERLAFRPLEEAETNKSIIFLAGPIQGTNDWQARAIEILHDLNPDVAIASPRRLTFDEADFDYDQQVDWETLHLRRAGRTGVILFWLAREEIPIPGRTYAQTTRFEFAEWVTQHKYMKARIVVGIEEGYSGAKYIRKRLQETPDIPIVDNLEEVCMEALKKIK